MQFLNFDRLQHELEDIQEELAGLPLNKHDCRIGDFGCGSGYATLSLMLCLNAIDCVGIDKDTWELPSVDEVRYSFNTEQAAHADSLSEKVKQLLDEGRYPTFRQDDVLKPQDLPKNLDLAYCRRFLANLGGDNLNRAIRNIVDCIKQNGFFCLVEEKNFRDDLSYSFFPNLKFLRVCQVERQDRVVPVFIHFYRKR